MSNQELSQLTLGNLRQLVDELKDAPDTMPVYVSVPTTSYLPKGDEGEQLDCFQARQANFITFEPGVDDEDEDFIEIHLTDPEWLRAIYGEDYEPEDLIQ